MGAMDALGPAAGSFMGGLQQAMGFAQRGKLLKAQAEHLKEQTAQLKAKQTLQDAMTKEMAAAAQASIGSPGVSAPPEGSYSGEAGPMAAAMQQGGGSPAAPQEAQAPNLGPLLATMMRHQPDKVLPYLLQKQTPQRPVVIGPGQTAVSPDTGAPMFSVPAEKKPQRTYRVDTGTRIEVRDADTHEVVQAIPKEKPSAASTPKTLAQQEFAAEQEAIPFDLSNPEDRADFAQKANKADLITTAQALQHSRQPIERVPQTFSERAPYEIYNRAIREGKSVDDALRLAETERNRIRESGSSASAAGSKIGEQRADVPIKIRDLLLFGKPIGTKYGQLKGEEPATPQMREEITQLDNAGAILDTLKGLADQLITAKTPVEAAKQAVVLHGGAFTKSNETASSYQDTKQMFLGVLSRTLGGERGVLTDKDINRVVNGIPGFRDTQGIKDFKMSAIRGILDVAVDAKSRVITAGPPSPEFRKKLNAALQKLDAGMATPSAETPTPTTTEEDTKSVGGKTYIKRGGKWFEQ